MLETEAKGVIQGWTGTAVGVTGGWMLGTTAGVIGDWMLGMAVGDWTGMLGVAGETP